MISKNKVGNIRPKPNV